MNVLSRLYSLFSILICRIKAALLKKGSPRRRISPIPVVSVGNLTVGGSEKTPLALEILRLGLEAGRRPSLVTRGYKGSWEKSGGVLSNGKCLLGGWREAGDEPAMIARRLPRAGIFVGKHRYLSCVQAKAGGFDLAVLDDGFQHLKLGRDLDIVLHDADSSSPLREGLSALSRADILLWKKGGSPNRLSAVRRRFPALAVYEYEVRPAALRLIDVDEALPAEFLRGKRVLAVSGIARPTRFAASVRKIGAVPVASLEFPDHHPYPGRSLARIAASFASSGAEAVLTTEKDAVKLAGRLPAELAARSYALGITLVLAPEFLDRLRDAFGTLRRGGARP